MKSFTRINDSHFFITRTLSGFGYSVANMGDIDGDGIVDLAVSEPHSRAIWILLMNADGTLKGTREITPGKSGLPASMDLTSNFGRSITNMGDMDGDGVSELAIGEQTYVPEDSSGGMHGRAWIFFLNSNGHVKSTIEINNQTPGFSGNIAEGYRFGYSVARIPDMDGDGAPELAIGVPGTNPTDYGGKVYILYLNGMPQTQVVSPQNTKMNAQIYPNPAREHIQIFLDPNPLQSVEVTVMSMHGKVVLKNNLEPNGGIYSMSLPPSLAPGMYFFAIQTPNRTIVRKVGVNF